MTFFKATPNEALKVMMKSKENKNEKTLETKIDIKGIPDLALQPIKKSNVINIGKGEESEKIKKILMDMKQEWLATAEKKSQNIMSM